MSGAFYDPSDEPSREHLESLQDLDAQVVASGRPSILEQRSIQYDRCPDGSIIVLSAGVTAFLFKVVQASGLLP